MLKFTTNHGKSSEVVSELFQLFKASKTWSKEEFKSFVENRKTIISKQTSHIFGRECTSSGSSLCAEKKYLWGPDFYEHHAFYDSLFYDHQPYILVSFLEDNTSRIFNKYDRLYFVFSNQAPDYEHIIENKHIVINPEVLAIYLNKYGNFIERFFDINTCVFSFTGSKLTKEHIMLFQKFGIDKIKDHLRCWDGGATFYTCKYYNKHWVDIAAEIKIIDNKLISTDLWNSCQLFQDYHNGDTITWERSSTICQCGFPIDHIEFISDFKHIEINDCIISYSKFLSDLEKHKCQFHYFYIEISDATVILNICGQTNQLFEAYIEELSKQYKQHGLYLKINSMAKLPDYSRKYRRIIINS